MSGGYFGLNIHYAIEDAIQSIDDVLKKNDEVKESDSDALYYYENGRPYFEMNPEALEEIKKGLAALKIAAVYAKRIDYFLSGDDGDDSFLERLKEDLEKLKNE